MTAFWNLNNHGGMISIGSVCMNIDTQNVTGVFEGLWERLSDIVGKIILTICSVFALMGWCCESIGNLGQDEGISKQTIQQASSWKPPFLTYCSTGG